MAMMAGVCEDALSRFCLYSPTAGRMGPMRVRLNRNNGRSRPKEGGNKNNNTDQASVTSFCECEDENSKCHKMQGIDWMTTGCLHKKGTLWSQRT